MYLVFDAILHKISLLGTYLFPKETDENSILDLGPHTPRTVCKVLRISYFQSPVRYEL